MYQRCSTHLFLFDVTFPIGGRGSIVYLAEKFDDIVVIEDAERFGDLLYGILRREQ